VQFKPALAINPTIQAHYAANRLRVVRQVHHSPNNAKDELDLVLFVNGIAVATAELKSDFTQSVHDAVDQYRFDRHPRPRAACSSRCWASRRRAGALRGEPERSDDDTRLAGPATTFLPFNRGNAGGAGNAPNPDGFATAYLWEEVWARESWLDILHRYLHRQARRQEAAQGGHLPALPPARRDPKAGGRRAATNGAGQRYLIQHSAGSGKTNSIAWTAHFLADLHDAAHKKVFDSVLVVSDRNVLDAQLQEAIFDFERTTGVVATITTSTAARAPSWPGAEGRQEDHRLHHPDLPVRAAGGAGTGGHRGQALRGDCRRGAQLADRRGGSQAQAAAVGRRNGPSCRTAARSTPRRCWPRRWSAKRGQRRRRA
jgi:type I restriction enzyme R subunit